jgi:Glycine cleavage H-protein
MLRVVAVVKVQDYEFPDRLLYDMENQIWYELLTDGMVRAGTSWAASLMRDVLVFTPKRNGRDFEKGRSFAVIEGGKWVGTARAAFAATIDVMRESGVHIDGAGRGCGPRCEFGARLEEARSAEAGSAGRYLKRGAALGLPLGLSHRPPRVSADMSPLGRCLSLNEQRARDGNLIRTEARKRHGTALLVLWTNARRPKGGKVLFKVRVALPLGRAHEAAVRSSRVQQRRLRMAHRP